MVYNNKRRMDIFQRQNLLSSDGRRIKLSNYIWYEDSSLRVSFRSLYASMKSKEDWVADVVNKVNDRALGSHHRALDDIESYS